MFLFYFFALRSRSAVLQASGVGFLVIFWRRNATWVYLISERAAVKRARTQEMDDRRMTPSWNLLPI